MDVTGDTSPLMSLLSRPPRSRITIILFLGFLVTASIVTALSSYGLMRVYQKNEELRHAAQGRSNKVAAIEDMLSLVRRSINQNFLLHASNNALSRLSAAERMADFPADFENSHRGFVALGNSPEEKQLLYQVVDMAAHAKVVQKLVVDAVLSNSPENTWPSADEVLRVHRQLEASLERLLEFERTIAYREVSIASTDNRDAFRLVLILFCVGFGVSSAIALVVVRLVSRVEQLLYAEKNLAEATLNSIDEGVITVNRDGCIEYINPVAEQLTGYSRDAARGRRLREIYRLLHLGDRTSVLHPAERPIEHLMRCEEETNLLVSHGGCEYEIEDSASPIHDSRGGVSGAVLVFRDVTATREMSRKLKWQAGHDALTGLSNRFEFQNNLEEAIKSARVDARNHALLFLDLDQFKVVNDTCGHASGDQLLCQIGMVIKNRIRESDMLARLGGDEFGVLLHSCQVGQAMEIARAIRKSIRDYRFVWKDKIFSVGASIGVASIHGHSRDSAEVMSAADLACYAAKEGGRDRVQLYESDHRALEHVAGMSMVAQIGRAIDDDLFRLYRQKIVGLQPHTAHQNKYEILLRMIDKGSILSPGAFLPVAERYSLMKAVDRWVIRQTFAYLQKAKNQLESGDDIVHTINLSGATINDDEFLNFLKDQLDQHPLAPERICFEVTETVAISSLANAAELMHEARKMGFKFALDDFGTGMSSFAYLKHLPVQYIKIDGGFVKDMVRNKVDHEIVDGITRISRAMNIQTIAEYVENEETMALLAGLGVDYAQGYVVGKPVPVDMP